jgi:hypothetical protein
MKKSILLIALTTLFVLSFQLSSFAQTKVKAENCYYFQLEIENETHEFIYVGYNTVSGHHKWLEMGPGLFVQAYDQVSNDEWSMYFKTEDGDDIQIDLFQMKAKAEGVEVKLKKPRDSYDCTKLGGSYID